MRIFALSMATALFFVGCASKRSEVKYSEPHQIDMNKETKTSSTASAKMKPYTINGKTYYPSFVSIGEEYSGVGSWYGADALNKYTASGEPYDMYGDTAAHKTLPMNTIVRVTNLATNKSVVVRINDRGPFIEGRIVDLSYSAAKTVGMDKTGTAPIKLAVLGFDGKISAAPVENVQKENRQISGMALQIGAFRNKSGADEWASKYSNVNGVYKTVVKSYEFLGAPMYRVMLTGFRGEAEVKDFIKEGRFPGSFAVSLD